MRKTPAVYDVAPSFDEYPHRATCSGVHRLAHVTGPQFKLITRCSMDKKHELAEDPGVTIFDEVEFALEEAEFMHKTTGIAYSVVGVPDKTGDIDQYLVMEKSRAVATAAFILETFRSIEAGDASGVH